MDFWTNLILAFWLGNKSLKLDLADQVLDKKIIFGQNLTSI